MILQRITQNNKKRVKRLLNTLGYTDNTSSDDIINSIKKYQLDSNLISDGIIGKDTINSIINEVRVKNLIQPIVKISHPEDFSDPEFELKIDNVPEILPTCENIDELINLIKTSTISRNVTRVVYHCTATQQSATVSGILKYWREQLGWANPGYHIIVKPDGSWTLLSDFNSVTNGVRGINSTSIHISYIGGIDLYGNGIDNRTVDQSEIFEIVYWSFKNKLPHLTFHGHNEFSNKACPSFNVNRWISEIK